MASIFTTKPVLWIRAFFEFLTTILIRFPIWVILALPRSNRPRPTWSIGRTVIIRVLQRLGSSSLGAVRTLIKSPDYRSLEQGKGVRGVWVPAVPHLIVGEVKKWAEEANVESVNIPAYWLERKGANLLPNARPLEGEKILFVLHGGAYAMQSAHPKDTAAHIPHGILDFSGASVNRAFMLEYRNSKSPAQPPSNPFPAALLDAIAGYNYLINEIGFAAENIVVEGDSAGGNLALALTRYLLQNKETDGIPPPPGGLILISPWTDLRPDPANRTSSFFANADSDFILDLVAEDGPAVMNFLGPHGKEAAVTNPYISPASLAPTMPPVSFEGYPRTLIISGMTEIFLDQIRVLYDRMKVNMGSKVRYMEFADVWHDFVLFPNLEPQRTEALNVIGGWIEE
ncbi:alpha/beta-hydrolase [Irpex rosettiformis]|uniref:Alpha/beta-hydrolase n=1 Tax=Irpex rosettiformis TaxID=378272 RepID=A0ACB8UG38_9APHY|nr:alpha/beta-hydrolase [Irpex rosettiformis]